MDPVQDEMEVTGQSIISDYVLAVEQEAVQDVFREAEAENTKEDEWGDDDGLLDAGKITGGQHAHVKGEMGDEHVVVLVMAEHLDDVCGEHAW